MTHSRLDFNNLTFDDQRVLSLGFVGEKSAVSTFRLLLSKKCDLSKNLELVEQGFRNSDVSFEGMSKAALLVHTEEHTYRVVVDDRYKVTMSRDSRKAHKRLPS